VAVIKTSRRSNQVKKVIASLTVALVLAVPAKSAISVDFSAVTGGIIANGGTTPGDLWNGSIYWELIWSPTASALPTLTPGTVDVGNYLLDSGTVSTALGLADLGDLDGSATYTDADVGSNDIDAGFVYGKFFDQLGSPSYWTITSFISPDNSDPGASPPQTPATLEIASGAYTFENGGAMLNEFQVVPEPSVLAFLGLGGLALAARRRFTA